MTLATRCASCGTVFRVAPEQLRVSEGWVRCGRCDAVFDAAEVLFDIDNGKPAHLDLGVLDQADSGHSEPDRANEDTETGLSVSDWSAPPVASPDLHRADPPQGRADAGARTSGRQEPHFQADSAAAPSGHAAGRAAARPAASPATRTHLAQQPESLLRTPSVEAEPWLDDTPGAGLTGRAVPAPLAPTPTASAMPSAGARASAGATRAGGLVGAASAAPPLPSFMRSAEHAAVWRRPAVRSALLAAALLLVTTLLLQTALLWRDNLAAHWPASAPALHGLCRLAGCQVLPLRRLEALAVDSSGLNRLDGSSLYRLQLVLRNRADTTVMAPALDLSLTDAQGKPVARRVLSLTELGLPQSALQPGQELPIKVLMSTGERRIDGYTVDLFYP